MELFDPQSRPNDQELAAVQVIEAESSAVYGKLKVPFVRESRTVKRVNQEDSGIPVKRSLPTVSTSVEELRKGKSALEILEARLSANFNSEQNSGELNSKHAPLKDLPHPSELAGKRKKAVTKKQQIRENIVTEHLSQLKRKQQLMFRENSKHLESAVAKRDYFDPTGFSRIQSSAVPSVLIETTNQCLMTFCTETRVNRADTLVDSFSPTTYTRDHLENRPMACAGGMMSWRGNIADIQRRTVSHVGGPRNIVVTASRTDQKCEILTPADIQSNHFLYMYRKNLGQVSSDDERNIYNDSDLFNVCNVSENQRGFFINMHSKHDTGNNFSSPLQTGFHHYNSNPLQHRTPYVPASCTPPHASTSCTVPVTDNFLTCYADCNDYRYKSPFSGIEESRRRKDSIGKEE